MSTYILAIDQGTTSTRAIIFNKQGKQVSKYQLEISQHYPQPDRIEQCPNEIWQKTLACINKAVISAGLAMSDIDCIGISNQRETVVIWDKSTGQPVYNAIVWQDRRTAEYCKNLANQADIESLITTKTGLILDPYFSASKIAWILDQCDNCRNNAEKGTLAFGTIDSFLIWRLTNGKSHVTDVTNASRTMLYNIKAMQWDEQLLKLFNIPKTMLAKVKQNTDSFGTTDKSVLGYEIPITGCAGDQQAAAIAQGCFHQGMVKSTYGTGCFMLLNTGNKLIHSKNKLLTSIAYSINKQKNYCLEGSIFVAGAAVQWLKDTLKLFQSSNEIQKIVSDTQSNRGVYLVPAFTGLGAPYWDPEARGALLGIKRDTSISDIVRASLEAVCYQSKDLLEAMKADGAKFNLIRVDGGMTANAWLLQFLADILGITVEKPDQIESSAKGAAMLAGLGANIYTSTSEVESLWHLGKSFTPSMELCEVNRYYSGWLEAIARISKKS